MRLFGGILPFIGYRVLDDDSRRELGLERLDGENSYWQTFEVEWFDRGVLIFAKPVIRP